MGSFIKTYDRVKDGRNAILALKRQCEGTSAVQTRKSLAYAKISSARYNGQKRGFTFDTYVQIHPSAHNTLAELNEPVPETKKVTDFLAAVLMILVLPMPRIWFLLMLQNSMIFRLVSSISRL